ncbi:cellulose biosynthesis protein BcsE [Chitinimonas sp.]|uniref:cellulose biosynthesis protein BcsE n=1 Tax=Chitinimonas sp. TaxID=1934313 RepID=UPI0035B076A1
MKRLLSKPACLGIEGLPEAQIRLAAGRLHVVAVEADGLAPALAMATLGRVAGMGACGALLSPQPADRLQVAESLGWHCAQAMVEQRLLVLQQRPDWRAGLHAAGMERLLDEMDALVPRGAVLVIEQADVLLADLNRKQLKRCLALWRNYLASHGASALWLVQALPPQLHLASRELGGIARIWREDGSLCWQTLQWQGREEGRPLRLLQDQRGALFAAGEGEAADYANFVPPDEQVVIATAGAVANERVVPSDWQIVADLAAVPAAASQAIAATVLLDGGGPYEFTSLLRCVHGLRSERGRRLKIVVRERAGRFRYSQEWVLRNLGVNQLASLDLSFSRLLSQIDALKGQRYQGEIVRDFTAAVTAAEPISDCGYLPPARFCAQVAEACRRARALGLINTLIRLPLLDPVDHLTALKALRAKRPGDVATCDADSVYLFLFACREPDAEETLARLFAMPVAELFAGQLRWHDSFGIERAITELAEQQEQTPAPDLSSYLPANPPPPMPTPAPQPPAGEPVSPYRLLPRWSQQAPAPSGIRTGRPAPLPVKPGQESA